MVSIQVRPRRRFAPRPFDPLPRSPPFRLAGASDERIWGLLDSTGATVGALRARPAGLFGPGEHTPFLQGA